MRNPRLDIQPYGPQARGHKLRGLEFTVRKLGVLMNLVPQLDHCGRVALEGPIYVGGRNLAAGFCLCDQTRTR